VFTHGSDDFVKQCLRTGGRVMPAAFVSLARLLSFAQMLAPVPAQSCCLNTLSVQQEQRLLWCTPYSSNSASDTPWIDVFCYLVGSFFYKWELVLK
jgi:hypothetical protein